MSYDPTSYDTAGQYATMGDEDGSEEIGAVPPGAMLRRPAAFAPRGAAPQQRGRQMFNPGALRAMTQPGGLTEARVRQLIAEHMSSLVPWSGIPPRPRPDEAMFPLGLGVATFNAGSGLNLTLTARPQRAFRGERLVLTSVRDGASTDGLLVTITDIKIGDVSQKVGGGALPANVFSNDAFGVRLMLDAAVPGVDITLSLTISGAPTGTDFLTIAGAIIGRATESQG